MIVSLKRMLKHGAYLLLSFTAFILSFITGHGSDHSSKETLISSITTQAFADSPYACASDSGCSCNCNSCAGCASSAASAAG